MKIRPATPLAPLTVLALAASSLCISAPAHAGTTIDVSGTTEARVKATSKTSASSVKIGKKMWGKITLNYRYSVLGIPLPSTGYYVNSFPLTFKKPSLVSANAPLKSVKYIKKQNTYLKTKQWEVNGKKGFSGKLDVTLKGDAKGHKKGTAYFYGGTYTCGNDKKCINAHAIVRAIVKK